MPRRRLRLRYSSDEEEEEEEAEARGNDNVVSSEWPTAGVQPETLPALSSNHGPIPNPSEPVTISDDELFEVSDNLTTPPPPDPSPPMPSSAAPPGSDGGEDSPVAEFLSPMGLRLRSEWCLSCLARLEQSVPQFSCLSLAAKAKLCFEQFLFSDMNQCGGGILPRDIMSMHLIELAGPFVLQVDEIVNISSPLKGRYQDANAGLKRCLKLSMTDGVQRIFGMEYRPIKDLQVLAPAGLKIVVSNVQVRHGLLILVPEVVEVLGGMVEELEEARKRLVAEVNKPPRGRRTRNGAVPSLATRATQAAWPLNGGNANNHVNSSTSANATQLQGDGQGFRLNATGNPRMMDEALASINVETTVSRVEHMHIDAVSNSGERAVSDLHSHVEPYSSNIHTIASRTRSSDSDMRASTNEHGENSVGHQTSRVTPSVEEMHINNATVRNASPLTSPGSGATEDAEDINMVDGLGNSLILSSNMEIPFTYLASLSAKWAAMKDTMSSVQGKIKCFLTGVKKFQYKQRPTYELLCYVDDGSLISEILIHHKVVEKGIGRSPMEVSAALSASEPNIVSTMKATLRQFQMFLANFEGTMLVEINKASEYPVALEMQQGCPTSDARLLFKRFESSAPRTPLASSRADPIDISP